MSITITGYVTGIVRFPNHPGHESPGGLVGGDDAQAIRSTFRSVGEAMTWCRDVLDGQVKPRWEILGDMVEQVTPEWQDAAVKFDDDADPEDPIALRYRTNAHTREWTELHLDGTETAFWTDDPAPKETR